MQQPQQSPPAMSLPFSPLASWCLIAALIAGSAASTHAFDLLGKRHRHGHAWWLDACRLPGAATCDDYCRKAMPRVRPPLCDGCCDDYCAKPSPLVHAPCLHDCCDNYCPKPIPCPTGFHCCYPDFYQFGPPDHAECCPSVEPACVESTHYRCGPSDRPQCCRAAPQDCPDTGAYRCGPPDTGTPCCQAGRSPAAEP